MSSLKLYGSTSGYVEIVPEATAGNNSVTLPNTVGSIAVKDASGNLEVGTGVTIAAPSSDTFTISTNGSERVRVDSSGRLAIGTASITGFSDYTTVQLGSTSSGAAMRFVANGDTPGTDDFVIYKNTSATYLRSFADPLIFYGNSSEYGRWDTSGRLLIGTSTDVSPASYENKIQVNTNSYTASALFRRDSADSGAPAVVFAKSRSSSLGGHTIVQNDDVLGNIDWYGADGVNTNATAARIQAQVDGTPGTNDMPARLVFSTTADGASSPTERARITSAGLFMVARTDTSLSSPGVYLGNDSLFVRNGGNVVTINRNTDDGNLIEFRQDTTVEGSISVSGSTVSYNGAHLSRWSQLVGIDPYEKAARPEILRGTVMSNLDEMCDWTCPTSGDCQDNEQLNKTEISSVDDDPNVAGVFQSWDDDDDTWVNDFYLAMTGDFVIRIAAGTTVQRGDLLCSAGDGTARPQGDRYIKDSTIAKVTSTTVSCTHPDGSYCVPCVLMAC